MNGIHDMGGIHGMGPLKYEKNEPVFHEPWEGRVLALTFSIGPWGRGQNWGNGRYELERIPPAEYLRMSYYERWFTRLVNRLLRSKYVTPAELESGKWDRNSPKPTLSPAPPPGQPAIAAAVAQNAPVDPGFAVGQAVRIRNFHPVGHTRLPRYTRGKNGTVHRDHGVFGLQDTDANGISLGRKRQHVYTIQFAARELWGEQASPRDKVFVEMWEDYLERP